MKDNKQIKGIVGKYKQTKGLYKIFRSGPSGIEELNLTAKNELKF